MTTSQGYIVYREQEVKDPYSHHMVYLGTHWVLIQEFKENVTLKEVLDQLPKGEYDDCNALKIYDKLNKTTFYITRTIGRIIPD